MDEKILSKMRKEHPNCSDTEIEGIYLLEKFKKDTITTSELMRLQFLTQMITKEEYADFLKIEEEYPDSDDEDDEDLSEDDDEEEDDEDENFYDEFLIEDGEYEMMDKLAEDVKNYEKDPDKAISSGMIILNKYGHLIGLKPFDLK